jgi:hypothetical protein
MATTHGGWLAKNTSNRLRPSSLRILQDHAIPVRVFEGAGQP